MKNAELLLAILIYVAASVWAVGFLLVVADALTGFRLIEKMPRLVDILGGTQKWVWLSIGAVLVLEILIKANGSDDASLNWAVQTTQQCEATFKERGDPSVTACLRAKIEEAEEARREEDQNYDPR